MVSVRFNFQQICNVATHMSLDELFIRKEHWVYVLKHLQIILNNTEPYKDYTITNIPYDEFDRIYGQNREGTLQDLWEYLELVDSYTYRTDIAPIIYSHYIRLVVQLYLDQYNSNHMSVVEYIKSQCLETYEQLLAQRDVQIHFLKEPMID